MRNDSQHWHSFQTIHGPVGSSSLGLWLALRVIGEYQRHDKTMLEHCGGACRSRTALATS